MNLRRIDNIMLAAVYSYAVKLKENEIKSYISHPSRNVLLKHYELIYVVSGESEVHYRKTVSRDTPGVIRFIPPRMSRETYYIKALQEGEIKYMQIFFHSTSQLPQEMLCSDYSQNPRLRQLFETVYDVWYKKDVGYYNRAVSLFYEILYEMQLTDAKASVSADAQKIEAGVKYLHTHYTDVDFEYKKLSEASGISDTYFRIVFKKIYGLSPCEYVRDLRMRRARELLRSSYISIAEIAAVCGYSDIYYFSKVFKEVSKLSPNAYRKLYREKDSV